MRACEIMTSPAVIVGPTATLEEVARLMLARNIGSVLVVDAAGRLRGIITESDFAAKDRGFPFSTFHWPQVFGRWLPREGVEAIYEAARSMTAEEIMSGEVVSVEEDAPLEEIIRLMLDRELHRLPVVRDGVPVGIVTRRDLLRVMIGEHAGAARR